MPKISVHIKKERNDRISHLVELFSLIRQDYKEEKQNLRKKYFDLLSAILDEIRRLQAME